MTTGAHKAARSAQLDALRRPGARAEPARQETAEPVQRPAGHGAVSRLLGTGRPLDDAVRRAMEARFGADFRSVRVHDHAQAHDSAAAHGAKAFTQGEDIVFSAGRFAPQQPEGRHLLAHELAHVVQQRRGGPAPQDGPASPTERGASAAADAVVNPAAQGSGPVSVAGASGVGVACEKEDKKKDEEDEPAPKGQASTTVLAQRTPKHPREPGVDVVKDPNKGKGTGAETTVPFDRYAGPDWNHIGGGSETASSRTSLARRSSHDKAAGREEGTAGIDFIVENVKTGRLVIGEQKATQGKQFNDATAITVSLETNLAHTIEVLQGQVKQGKVHPDALPGLERSIARLQATHDALVNRTELPPGVVFELTNVRGEGEQIGKGHIDLLAEKYGDNPAFLQHLLDRTFVRDPALAKAKGRDPKGKPGTDADPGVVPAKELLNEPAREELARLKAGKSPAEWKQQQASDKATRDKQKADDAAAQAKATKAQRQKETDERRAAKQRQKDDVRRTGDEAHAAKLKELQDQRKAAGEPDPKNKTAQKKRDTADRAEARKASGAAKQREIDKQQQAAAQQKAKEEAQRQADRAAKDESARQKREAEARAEAQAQAREKALADARKQVESLPEMTPEQWEKLPPDQRKNLEKLAAGDPALAAQLNKKVNAQQTQAFEEHARRQNAEAEARNRRNAQDEKMGKAAHRLNQAAGGIRAVDAFLDARDRGEGYGSALFGAGKTYLENTNQLFGAVATYESRVRKEKLPDGREQQYYGEDAGDAFFGTLGENIANYVVPGAGWDQLINGASNLVAAGDDHLKRGQTEEQRRNAPADLRTGTDLAAELTPSRMFASTIGAGMRAFYDLGKAAGGQPSGVDKFGDDGVRGKLGSVIQPWAMLGDFVGNLGGDDAGTALNKTLDKSKGTTLSKLGDALGDGMYALGQSADAKAGKYGPGVQGISMALGITSDLVAGDSFEQALDKAADAGKGSTLETVGNALGDAAFTTVETGKEVYDKGKEIVTEDLPRLKDAVIDKGTEIVTEDLPALKEEVKERAVEEYHDKKDKLVNWWNSL